MPITLPKLDDKTYADFVESSLKLIPSLYPDWTNHNPSDPGIALIELLAWLSEIVLYRVNQIPDANIVTFLKLLNEPSWTPPAALQTIDAHTQSEVESALRQATLETITALRERYRAVTADDYEYLVTQVWENSSFAQSPPLAGQFVVQRAHCVPLRNLASDSSTAHLDHAPGHISILIIAHRQGEVKMIDHSSADADSLIQSIFDFLDKRRLITIRHHVVLPRIVPVTIKQATLVPYPDAPDNAELITRTLAAVQNIFDPLKGGKDGQGWPLGRDIYVSEVYEVLDQLDVLSGLPGIDYVKDVRLDTADETRLQKDAAGEVIGITLHPYEFAVIQVEELIVERI